MDDWRKYRSIWSLITIICLTPLVVILVILMKQVDMNNISNGLSSLAIFISLIVLIITVIFNADQTRVAINLSLLESERQHLENSIDKFYLPLLNLLSFPSGDVVDFVKLNEINCHRYLAKKCVLSYYKPFYDECIETKHLPESTSHMFLKMVNAEIDALNDELLKSIVKFRSK
jgi:hypothetical protein